MKSREKNVPVWAYNKHTGIITKDGVPKGSYSKGYLLICYKGSMRKAHHLAYELQGLPVPSSVDHINGVRDDNRWLNLRAATPRENSCNRRGMSRSGFKKGAYYNKRRKQWYSRIRVRGVGIYLGTFQNEEEAHEAYCEAAVKYNKEFARFE
jgi:hypothetical protein